MRIVETDQAPKPIGPYSQAIITGRFVFCSGQIGIDPASGELVRGGVGVEADRAMKNIEAVLKAAGSSIEQVVRVTLFLTRIEDFKTVNDVYTRFFSSTKPSRSTVAVAALPKSANVEIEATAVLD